MNWRRLLSIVLHPVQYRRHMKAVNAPWPEVKTR